MTTVEAIDRPSKASGVTINSAKLVDVEPDGGPSGGGNLEATKSKGGQPRQWLCPAESSTNIVDNNAGTAKLTQSRAAIEAATDVDVGGRAKGSCQMQGPLKPGIFSYCIGHVGG